MGIFDRIWRLIKANINSLVNQAEDPEKILEQTVLEMQDDLIQLRQGVAQAIATQKRTEREGDKAQAQSEEWYKRAQLALQKGDEKLAREALMRRKSYEETATAIKSQLQQQTVIVDKLKQNMRVLESKIIDAKAKKDMYIARARTAKASEKLNQVMGNINTDSALSAFEKMEEKVLQLEARSEAIAELGSSDLESKFAALEGGTNDIDQEIAAMKVKMIEGNKKLP